MELPLSNRTGRGLITADIRPPGPHPFQWTVSNLSFRPLIFVQRIPQRSSAAVGGRSSVAELFLRFGLAATECKAPGATISVDP
jgi:hypothetical protein